MRLVIKQKYYSAPQQFAKIITNIVLGEIIIFIVLNLDLSQYFRRHWRNRMRQSVAKEKNLFRGKNIFASKMSKIDAKNASASDLLRSLAQSFYVPVILFWLRSRKISDRKTFGAFSEFLFRLEGQAELFLGTRWTIGYLNVEMYDRRKRKNKMSKKTTSKKMVET